MGATEATELKLFIDNDAALHRQQRVPILKNLATKKVRSQYKHDLAVKAFGYLVESGAKKYAKEFGSPGQPWHKLFDVPTRKAVAQELTRAFEVDFELGNYDHLLPKKYQKEMLTGQTRFPRPGHATKKLAGKKLRAHVRMHEPRALRSATDPELRRFYQEEKRDVERARTEAARRGLSLHARKKQLDREIADVVPSWRGRR